MHVDIRSGAAGARHRRLWWLLYALVFAVAAGMQFYLAITMALWWAWTAAAILSVIALVSVFVAATGLAEKFSR